MARPRTPVGSHGSFSKPKRQANGTWTVKTSVRDPDGESRQVTASGSTAAKAETALRTKLLTRQSGSRGPVTPETSVARVCDLWLADVMASKRAPGTKERYELAVRRYVKPGLGELSVREVSPGVAARWLRALGIQPKLARTVLTQVLDVAVLDGAIDDNPVRKVPSIVKDDTERKSPRALRAAELLAVRNAISSWEESVTSGHKTKWLPLRAAIVLQLVTGTRIGEVLAIRWCDVDLDAGLVNVTGALTPVTGVGLVRGDVKTPAGYRGILLPEPVVELLRSMLADLPEGTDRSIAPVLRSWKGTWVWPNNVRRAWREARSMSTEVDLSWVTPHSLRKTAGTSVAEVAGVLAASKLLGQSGTRVFEQHYMDRAAVRGDHREVLGGLVDGWGLTGNSPKTATDDDEQRQTPGRVGRGSGH